MSAQSSAARVVLINGASGGLGPAVVKAFAAEGARLVLTGARQEPLDATAEALELDAANTLCLATDLTKADAVEGLVQQVQSRFGEIDVVAHVSGGFKGGQPVAETPVETWQFLVDLNLSAAFNTARAVLPAMLARRAGKLVFVSSRSGSVPSANVTAYTVTKSGLNMLVQCLAEETRQHGVNVNAVAPSVIDTEPNRKANPGADYSAWVTPESIAGVMAFLASDAARDVHGAIVPVYGRA
jgi:NAD(P)-dependent dehydrogenase (short-subunit alcohol dehydrogenase family)